MSVVVPVRLLLLDDDRHGSKVVGRSENRGEVSPFRVKNLVRVRNANECGISPSAECQYMDISNSRERTRMPILTLTSPVNLPGHECRGQVQLILHRLQCQVHLGTRSSDPLAIIEIYSRAQLMRMMRSYPVCIARLRYLIPNALIIICYLDVYEDQGSRSFWQVTHKQG